MKNTWASGAIELLSHADSHMDSKAAFDQRIAFISVDNAVENIVRTFLALPRSKSGVSIKKREIDEAGNIFPKLLEILYKYAGDKLIGIDDADIEHYHRIRNTLYHQGTGLSVDEQYLTAYRGIAEVLLQNLFNEKADGHQTEKISLETLILNWNRIEQIAKKEIEKLGISTSYKWEEKFIHSHISEETAKKISELRKARNTLVHSTEVDNDDIKFWVNRSNEILKEFEKGKKVFDSPPPTMGKTKNPVCFISYAQESDEHYTWVRQLAEYLQRNGVNTILDQWDLRPGMDIAHFMEKSISSSDYVILICTPLFSEKANEGVGGVGYEKNIVTSEIFKEIKPETNIVPILRTGDNKAAIPRYLGLKKYIDFRDDKNFEINAEELIRHIYKIPKFQKPSPGQFPQLGASNSQRTKNNAFSISNIDAISINWKEQGYPYFLVEGLEEIHKAFVRHPPSNIQVNNPVTLAFLLLSGFHFGGNWCYWLSRNIGNALIYNVFESCLSVSYRGPLYRSLFALQYLGDQTIFSNILESNGVNEITKNLIQSFAIPGNVIEYLTQVASEDKGKTGQRAAVVLKEISQYCKS